MAKIIALILSFFQVVFVSMGIIDLQPGEINYGGTPYSPVEVSNWLTLIDGGESDYVIVCGEEASESEQYAASQLQHYLKQISGKQLSIISDASSPVPHEIVVGRSNRYTPDAELGDEEFILKVTDEKLFIVGGQLRGTLYGVYTFLEEQLGCRWFTPELEVIPETPTVKINADLDDNQAPLFEYRDVYWSNAYDSDWQVRQKVNSNVAVKKGANLGGGISYAEFAHSMERLIPESYFEEHPEYFSYREEDNIRTTDQRCLTNPEVLQIAIANTRATLQRSPGANIISITQNDNQKYCQCENCKASDEYYGGPSGTNIWFVNQIAEALGEEFPDVAFDTFAYQYTRSAPVNIEPLDNVIVRLCSIECCFCHPLSECGHIRHEELSESLLPKKSSFAKDISDWSNICDRLYIWDYTTNFLMYLSPFPNFHVLSANMQFFVENNVKGVFEQGNYTGGKSGEFGELRAYILAKLLWNPYCDVEYHMMDFMNAYYGEEAAGYIKEYIDTMTKRVSQTNHLFIFDWHYEIAFFSPSEHKEIDGLWEKAKSCTTDEAKLERIRRSELSWRHYKACLLIEEYSALNPLRYFENKKLYEDIKELDITRITEHSELMENPNFMLRPVEWRN